METTTQIQPGTVVVAYDGSDHAKRALRWATDQADLEGRPLTIVTVTQQLSGWELSALAGGWTPPYEVQHAIRRHAQEELEALKVELRQSAPDLEVGTLACEGDPRQVLLDLSRDASSLFLGSRGRGVMKSLLLGSVSVALARGAECPVFIIRDHDTSEKRQGVLVGTDCGELTRPTLEFAYRQAAMCELPLTVLYCVSGLETVYGTGSVLDDLLEGYESERRELAEAIAGMAAKFPEVTVHAHLAHGAADVCLVQESQHMDLLVVGHHRGRTLGDLVHLGSFVAPIVENASCPVAIAVDRTAAGTL